MVSCCQLAHCAKPAITLSGQTRPNQSKPRINTEIAKILIPGGSAIQKRSQRLAGFLLATERADNCCDWAHRLYPHRLVRKPELNPSDCRFLVWEFQDGAHDSGRPR